MLQIAAHKLHGIQCDGAPPITARLFVTEPHLATFNLDDAAISHFSEALHINPGYAEVHNNLGIALARKGRIEDAVVHFREALRIRPDFVGAHHNLKEVLRLQGKH